MANSGNKANNFIKWTKGTIKLLVYTIPVGIIRGCVKDWNWGFENMINVISDLSSSTQREDLADLINFKFIKSAYFEICGE